MPKKIFFESATHQLLSAASRYLQVLESEGRDTTRIRKLLNSCTFQNQHPRILHVCWSEPVYGEIDLSFEEASFYMRGDCGAHMKSQCDLGLIFGNDVVKEHNRALFDSRIRDLFAAAGLLHEH